MPHRGRFARPAAYRNHARGFLTRRHPGGQADPPLQVEPAPPEVDFGDMLWRSGFRSALNGTVTLITRVAAIVPDYSPELRMLITHEHFTSERTICAEFSTIILTTQTVKTLLALLQPPHLVGGIPGEWGLFHGILSDEELAGRENRDRSVRPLLGEIRSIARAH